MADAITRDRQTDSEWEQVLHEFMKSAHTSRIALLIDYLFELPDQIVPQRLYRYDVFDDYLSRHRDDFEFGYDLITRAERITAPRKYGLYVIELDGNPNHVYVGQTWYLPHERLAQHNTGFAAFHAARLFKRGARGTLRPDLYRHAPRVTNQKVAEEMEQELALQLKKLGFRVEGGH
jgi:hypothetical protein